MNTAQNYFELACIRFVRWCWEKLTGEDPLCVSMQLRSLERLNGVHCEFLKWLEREHPELNAMIEWHQQERLHALHPPLNMSSSESNMRQDAPAVGARRTDLQISKWWAFGWAGASGKHAAMNMRGETTGRKLKRIERRMRVAVKRREAVERSQPEKVTSK